MSGWNKQNWIKDILSKSGTEITEINEDKSDEGDKKMVHYTAIPLMMQTEHSPPQYCGEDALRISHLDNLSPLQNDTHLYGVNSNTNLHIIDSKPITEQHTLITMTNVPTSRTSTQQFAAQSTKPQYKCDQCSMFFGSKSAHTSHLKSHARANGRQTTTVVVTSTMPNTNGASSDPYQCDVCKKTFAVPARLVRHYRTHTGERPFECEFCHKMFSVKENLQVHRRIHTKERPYKCDVCGRAFEHSGKLHRHMRIHTGERPHKCSVCAKTFIQSGQLVIHMRTHTGEKPYKCPVEGCGKGFTCSKQLKVHSRTHTGEKPYHCDICFRDFGYNHVLKLHRVQHYGSKCYKCTICDETFKNKKEMEAHIKGHANGEPDDQMDSNATDENGAKTVKVEQSPSAIELVRPTSSSMSSPISSTSPLNSAPTPILPTPRESSSDANSDADDISYYNMYSRYEQIQNSPQNYSIHSSSGGGHGGGVNPALLAAVTEELNHQSNQSIQNNSSNSVLLDLSDPDVAVDNSFMYQPFMAMRQQSYFSSVPKVEEFKPSIDRSNDIVKRVEAAIAGAELTPPRSTPESPDRSSSPESDSVLMADRDIMSLPLRKRKNYLRDNQDDNNSGSSSASSTSPPPKQSSSSSSASMVRMSSVIQFAKAS